MRGINIKFFSSNHKIWVLRLLEPDLILMDSCKLSQFARCLDLVEFLQQFFVILGKLFEDFRLAFDVETSGGGMMKSLSLLFFRSRLLIEESRMIRVDKGTNIISCDANIVSKNEYGFLEFFLE